MKKFTAFLLAVMAIMSFASCQLSQIVPPSVTTEGSTQTTTKAPDATTGATEIPDEPKYDYMANDLTQFVTLCEYKGIKIEKVEYNVSVPEISFEVSEGKANIKYTFTGECALSAEEFDAVAGGHGLGNSTKDTDENGNTVYTYITSISDASGKVLPATAAGVNEEIGKIQGVFLPYTTLKKVKPTTIQLASIRTTNPKGLRFMAFVDDELRASADEIGFMIARASTVANENDFVFGENPTEGKGNVNAAGVVYVYGTSYLKDSHEKLYANSANDAGVAADERYSELEGSFYTAALVGLDEDKYDDDLICRPYIKIGSEIFYGDTITRNIRQVANTIANGGYKGLDNDEIDYINSVINA